PQHEVGAPSALDASGRPIIRLAAAAPQGGPITVGQVGPTALIVRTVVEKKALIGAGTREESVRALDVPDAGEITALALDNRGEELFVGTARGQILRYDFRDRANPRRADTVGVGEGAAITVLDFLIGDRTLIAGTQSGRVVTWQVVPATS